MIIGFDLDGVIFNPPVPFYGLIKKNNLDFLLHRFRKVATIRNIFYSFIRINQDMVKFLNQLAEGGHRIVIISGHSNEYTEEVSACLRNNGVPFNELCLFSEEYRSHSQFSYSQFKLEKIVEERCNLYVEDRLDIVRFLREHLGGICRVIHYRNHRSLIELKQILEI